MPTTDTPATPNTAAQIERFLQTYAHHSDKGDVPELIACFADVFLAAGPDGAQLIRSTDFALALPKRYKLFQAMGCRSTALTGVRQTWLDQRYVSVWTEWQLTFERPGTPPHPITVESTYLIDAGSEPFRILVYLAHSDIMKVLTQHGIAPV